MTFANGAELLKKTGSGNLFMVFGEPDIDVRPTEDGQLTLEIRGSTGKLAVKVINHYGDEVMKVFAV